MKTNDWEKQLRDRLADYQEPAGDDLWAAIEARTEAEERRSKGAKTTWRWAAAAAATLLIVAGAGLIYRTGTTGDGTEPTVARTEKAATQLAAPGSGNGKNGTTLAAVTEATAKATARTTGHDQRRTEGTDKGDIATTDHGNDTENTATTTQPEERPDTPTDDATESGSARTQRPRYDNGNKYGGSDTRRKRPVNKQGTPRVSLGLLASNGITDNSLPVERMLMAPENMNAAMVRGDGSTGNGGTPPPDNTMYLSNYGETIDHHRPLSFGLSLRYKLWKCLWVESGLQYTRLRSDFIHLLGPDAYTDHQTLHYLGVPLRLGCELFHVGGLSLYASAGAQADFCLSATVETNGMERDIDRDRTQLSADLSLGVQYTFIPHLGVYVEPGMKYYFDNGSPLINYFKENNKCLNLRIGLRYDF